MHPVLFRFHGLTLYSYGAAVAAAFFLSLVVSEARAPRHGIEKRQVADVLLVLFIGGVLGARLFYVIQHWADFAGDPMAAVRIQEGGLVWYGGLLCAIAGGAVYARWQRWPVMKLADFFAPVSAMAHGIGRIGCFFNGCCYGREAESFWAIALPGEEHARYPAQLYEAFGLFAISAVLFIFSRRPRREGSVLWLYLCLYGLLRFSVEFLRGDNDHYFSLTIPQWMSLALVGAALFFSRMPREKKR